MASDEAAVAAAAAEEIEVCVRPRANDDRAGLAAFLLIRFLGIEY